MDTIGKFVRSACIAVLAWLAAFAAIAQPTMPTVTVTAPREGGGNVLCYGSEACGWVINAMLAEAQMQMENQTQDEPLEETAINGQIFCNLMRQNKPQNCGSTRPSAPGFDPNWRGNGCGPIGVASWAADVTEWIINATIAPMFSGDLNSPFAGVSFLNACNRHDSCYSSHTDRTACDGIFDNGSSEQVTSKSWNLSC